MAQLLLEVVALDRVDGLVGLEEGTRLVEAEDLGPEHAGGRDVVEPAAEAGRVVVNDADRLTVTPDDVAAVDVTPDDLLPAVAELVDRLEGGDRFGVQEDVVQLGQEHDALQRLLEAVVEGRGLPFELLHDPARLVLGQDVGRFDAARDQVINELVDVLHRGDDEHRVQLLNDPTLALERVMNTSHSDANQRTPLRFGFVSCTFC